MDIDLLFIAVKQSEWRNISEQGTLQTTFLNGENTLWSFEGNEAEKIINHFFEGNENLLLVVVDPLRIQAPIKRFKKDGMSFIEIRESIPFDAIIDKIILKPSKEGHYSLNVKHYD